MFFRVGVLLLLNTMAFSAVAAADLLQIWQEALQNDPIYASAQASYRAAQEKPIQGRALLLPNVNLLGSGSLADTHNARDDAPTNKASKVGSGFILQLTQPLIHWGNWQKYEQSKLQLLMSAAEFKQSQLDLMARVAQAYFDILFAQDTLTTARVSKEAISVQLDSAERNFELGTVTVVDQHEAKAQYDWAVAEELLAENNLEVKRATLQHIIGHTPDELKPLRKKSQLPIQHPGNIDEWVATAERDNYNVVGAEMAKEIAKRRISFERAGHLPTLDLVAHIGRSRSLNGSIDQNFLSEENSRSIGVQLNVPLFTGFAFTSKVRESIALASKASNDLLAAKRNAALAARQAFWGVTNGLAQIKAYETATMSSQSALDSTMMGYEVGVRINKDVLNAQQQLFIAQQNLAKARYDTIMNGLRLKLATASLKDEDLVEINKLLL